MTISNDQTVGEPSTPVDGAELDASQLDQVVGGDGATTGQTTTQTTNQQTSSQNNANKTVSYIRS